MNRIAAQMMYGVRRPDFSGIANVECAQAPVIYKGYEVRVSPLVGEKTFQKIKIWKHKSLKRPISKRVYNYKRHQAVLIGNILFVSEKLYERLSKQAS